MPYNKLDKTDKITTLFQQRKFSLFAKKSFINSFPYLWYVSYSSFELGIEECIDED